MYRCDYNKAGDVELQTAKINGQPQDTICELGCGCVSECQFSYKENDVVNIIETDWEEIAAIRRSS